jgi:hypothetical protein
MREGGAFGDRVQGADGADRRARGDGGAWMICAAVMNASTRVGPGDGYTCLLARVG